MLTSIIRTIISSKFQINPLTVTLFSGSGSTHPPLPSPVAGEISKCSRLYIGLKYLLTLKLLYEMVDQTSGQYIHAEQVVFLAHILYS